MTGAVLPRTNKVIIYVIVIVIVIAPYRCDLDAAPDMLLTFSCPDQPAGFSSSCEQCLAERREADSEASLATSVLSTKNLVTPADSPGREEVELRGSRVTQSEPGRTYECEEVCRKSTMIVFSTIGMTVILLGYIALGAVIFSTVESKYLTESPTVMNSNDLLATLSHEVNTYLDTQRELTVNKLWRMTEQMNILYPVNWTNAAAEELLSFQLDLSRKLTAEIMSVNTGAKPSALGTLQYVNRGHGADWGLARGTLYSLSLLTTIGREVLIPTADYAMTMLPCCLCYAAYGMLPMQCYLGEAMPML